MSSSAMPEALERGDDPGHLLRGGVAGGLGGVALDADAEAHRRHVRDDGDLAFAAHRDGVLGRGAVRGGPGDRRLVGAVQEWADHEAEQERSGGDRGAERRWWWFRGSSSFRALLGSGRRCAAGLAAPRRRRALPVARRCAEAPGADDRLGSSEPQAVSGTGVPQGRNARRRTTAGQPFDAQRGAEGQKEVAYSARGSRAPVPREVDVAAPFVDEQRPAAKTTGEQVASSPS